MADADYIIVGGGTAGCVVANRLSASGRNRVILLEAGGADSSPWIHVPLGYGKLAADDRYSIRFETLPQPALNSRSVGLPRGQVLGGCSSTNGLLYVRGQPDDFDEWEQVGNPGWGFRDVLPYFRKAESHHRGASAWHGGDGPIGVSGPAARHPLAEAFIEAALCEGLDRNEDFNGPRQEGAGYYEMTTRSMLRSSSATAYLRPANGRKNLQVVTNVKVRRVVIDGRTARGVAIRTGEGVERTLQASRGVIVCAGAISSPHLLLLSGIGDGAALGHHGIASVHHLPGVGRNLIDHANVRLNHMAARPITLNDRLRGPWGQALSGLEYLLLRRGPLTVSAGFGAAFYASSGQKGVRPDFQAYLLLFQTDASGTRLAPGSGFMTSGYQMRPLSRGSVTLRSAQPDGAPLIDPGYFSAEPDLAVTIAGLKRLRKILSRSPMADLIASHELSADADDAELAAYVRERAGTGHHFVGSCRMGNGPDAVVDARLRVRGIDRLRVIDASIMPTMISGNTCAPTVMIAEKGADMILEDARNA